MYSFLTKDPEQKKRSDAGRKIVKKIRIKGETGTFQGSGKNPYIVTLEKCSCGDFIRHHEPCKHMFALAINLGKVM